MICFQCSNRAMTLGILCSDCYRRGIELVERELKNKLDADNNVITDLAQLKEWTIVELVRHRPGVVKYIAQRHSPPPHGSTGGGLIQIIGYAKDAVFAAVQLPP